MRGHPQSFFGWSLGAFARSSAKWVEKFEMHSPHDFSVCLFVLIFLFGKIFGCV